MAGDDEILYKLWLSILCGHDPSITNKLVGRFGSAREIFMSDAAYRKAVASLSLSRTLRANRSLEKAKQLLEYCNQNGIHIFAIGEKGYPKRLAEVDSPPQILYARGELPDIDGLVCISIVGSRECSEYGRKFAARLASDLAASGVIVISGMAKGIDAAAHTGALNAGNVTVAALAGGADVIYPVVNAPLYEHIIRNGAVVSERPPGTRGRGSFYRERNRIIVGMSNGVVIVEGKNSSGTKLSARWAIDCNRDIFAVPGKPDDYTSELPNSLIKDSAKLITSAEDILSEYISVYPEELKAGLDLKSAGRRYTGRVGKTATTIRDDRLPAEKARPPKPDLAGFNERQRIILEYLYNNNEAVHIDEIARACEIETTELSFIIIQLLMERVIKEHPGEYYSIEQ